MKLDTIIKQDNTELLVRASISDRGEVKGEGVEIIADITANTPPTGDSKIQDINGKKAEQIFVSGGKVETINLFDNGRDGDEAANDGVYSGIYKPEDAGIYNVHFIANIENNFGTMQREHLESISVQ